MIIKDKGMNNLIKSFYSACERYGSFSEEVNDRIEDIIKALNCSPEEMPNSYIQNNISLVNEVLNNNGDFMDLDCMVAMSKVLGYFVDYKEYRIVNNSGIFDDYGLFNVDSTYKEFIKDIIVYEIYDDTYLYSLPEKYLDILGVAYNDKEELLKEIPDWREKLFDYFSKNKEEDKEID